MASDCKRCSREMAQKIVDLLMANAGLLNTVPACNSLPQLRKHAGGIQNKLEPSIEAYIKSQLGLCVASECVKQITTLFGRTVHFSTVCKIWKRQREESNAPRNPKQHQLHQVG